MHYNSVINANLNASNSSLPNIFGIWSNDMRYVVDC